MSASIDKSFLALPYKKLAEIVLAGAREAGASYADFRCEAVRAQHLRVRDLELESLFENTEIGFAVRVIYKGAWGFAASSELNVEAALATLKLALKTAKQVAGLNQEPVELAPEPAHRGQYISAYEINPFDVPVEEKTQRFLELNRQVLKSKPVNFVRAAFDSVQENKFFANLEGSQLLQQRLRVQGNLEATIVSPDGTFEDMRTLAPPAGQGWEYFAPKGTYDIDSDAAELGAHLHAKTKAPSVKAGKYDLVIDPSNLFLTIHESVGHATELDRVLGYEANYAGTSFATTDKLGKLRYGSEAMNITGDRNAKHGLASIGYDDEGVKTGQFDIVKNGILSGYQLNRQMARKFGFKRSNGCTFADSFSHIPLQRMPNVSLQPAAQNVSTADLISRVENGIYIVGDKSWSIDMQRYNFQFTGQRFFAIKDGKLAGQLKDVIYQSNTLDFWNSLEAVGGPQTYVLGGAFNCGKGQPGQVAPVSHGCPSALFRNVNILNAAREGTL